MMGLMGQLYILLPHRNTSLPFTAKFLKLLKAEYLPLLGGSKTRFSYLGFKTFPGLRTGNSFWDLCLGACWVHLEGGSGLGPPFKGPWGF